ncbi:putative pectin lyase A [Pseudomassariella vexata]|uniref:pectin lyase n=1 Tax=Pseudomassariella vexata TaxID=1141098 RepID=A0A1Y2E6C4_9PEZI|nr:putative pectin lyase A [Pseudomassariella vexata]ORY67120.1 putative pectin lyase A [Pseudomassariella vexata]
MFCKTLLAIAAMSLGASAVSVTGKAEGFAAGVTGGGSATPVYPSTTAELIAYLGDSSPRVIVLSKTYDFRGTEGTTSGTGCAPWGTGSGCQVAINQNNWCTNYEPDAPSVSVNYDNAGIEGITVASDKTLIGVGTSGVIIGKGLRIANGATNVIIQNIEITNLNPQYVWGGDAITLDGTDMVWIDHVTTSLIGRQHIVLGTSASGRVTISNCNIDGSSSWSATCDGYHYWTLYFTGSDDRVTFKDNYVHHFSGRAPKVGGNTLLHAINNYWYGTSSTGHAFEIGSGANVLAEGNIFQNVATVVDASSQGKAFTSPSTNANTACTASLGRVCQLNGFGSSGTFSVSDTDFLSKFNGYTIASASAYSSVSSVIDSCGYGTI